MTFRRSLVPALALALTAAGCGGGYGGPGPLLSPAPGGSATAASGTATPPGTTATPAAGTTPASGTTPAPGTTPAATATPAAKTTPAPGPTATGAATAAPTGAAAPAQIKHIVILIQENRTFDNLFHGFTEPSGAVADYANFAYDLKGDRIPLTSSTIEGTSTGGNGHADFLADYDNGKMDGFYDNNGAGATLPASAEKNFQVSYVEQTEVQPYWDMATQGSLAERFFHGLTGGTEPSHMIFAAGTSTPDGNPNRRITENAAGAFGCDDMSHATDTFMTLNADGTQGADVDSCFHGVKTIEELIDAGDHTWRWYSGPTAGPVDGMPGGGGDVGGDLDPLPDYSQIYFGPDSRTSSRRRRASSPTSRPARSRTSRS